MSISSLIYPKWPHSNRERIIVPLDQHFVIYTGGASVDEGAGVDEGDVFYTGSLFCRNSGIEEGSGQSRSLSSRPASSTPSAGVEEAGVD